jgi:hypothetical protein
MNKLKWYSGGEERRKKAESIIIELVNDFKKNSGNDQIQNVLSEYLEELRHSGSAVPMILSRMNLEISKVVRTNGITLSDNQSKKLKEVIALSSIRYGY